MALFDLLGVIFTSTNAVCYVPLNVSLKVFDAAVSRPFFQIGWVPVQHGRGRLTGDDSAETITRINAKLPLPAMDNKNLIRKQKQIRLSTRAHDKTGPIKNLHTNFRTEPPSRQGGTEAMGRRFGKMSASIFREHWVGAAQKIKIGYTGINRKKIPAI